MNKKRHKEDWLKGKVTSYSKLKTHKRQKIISHITKKTSQHQVSNRVHKQEISSHKISTSKKSCTRSCSQVQIRSSSILPLQALEPPIKHLRKRRKKLIQSLEQKLVNGLNNENESKSLFSKSSNKTSVTKHHNKYMKVSAKANQIGITKCQDRKIYLAMAKKVSHKYELAISLKAKKKTSIIKTTQKLETNITHPQKCAIMNITKTIQHKIPLPSPILEVTCSKDKEVKFGDRRSEEKNTIQRNTKCDMVQAQVESILEQKQENLPKIEIGATIISGSSTFSNNGEEAKVSCATTRGNVSKYHEQSSSHKEENYLKATSGGEIHEKVHEGINKRKIDLDSKVPTNWHNDANNCVDDTHISNFENVQACHQVINKTLNPKGNFLIVL
jgi:hypothetical protein